MGWIVAAVVIIAAAVFYFWPSISAAPATSGQATTTPQATEQSSKDVSGTWRSQTDAKFTREIRTDGVIIDRYEGDTTAGVNGEWVVVDAATETGLTTPATSLAGLTVIKVVWEGGVETTYFAINSVDEKTLTTTDLTGKGEVTIYSRI